MIGQNSERYSMDLTLAYKGDRKYLHGTDIYNTVTRIIQEKNQGVDFTAIKLAFHKIIKNQCQFIFGDHAALMGALPENITFELEMVSPSAHIAGWFIETDNEVTCRVPYPEDEITKKCTLTEKRIAIDLETGYTPVEVLVAMTKDLHLNIYPVKSGKWYFAKLELKRLLQPMDACQLRVEGDQNLFNRLTRSRVYSGTDMLGHIYFSLVG